MGDRFDQLAKDAGGELSRRQAFWRIGGGLLAAALASLGLTRAGNDCGKLCAACCSGAVDSPPRPGGGADYAKCIRDCHLGLGPCGPLVCKQD